MYDRDRVKSDQHILGPNQMKLPNHERQRNWQIIANIFSTMTYKSIQMELITTKFIKLKLHIQTMFFLCYNPSLTWLFMEDIFVYL